MAQRVHVVLVDDIDESDADETVSFGLDGDNYEIDLNADHARQLRDALSVYVGLARRKTAVRGKKNSRSGGTTSRASAADIRAWARQNGWDVPERGRVSADVRSAYDAAN